MPNNDNEEPPRPKGLQIGAKAPLVDTADIYERPVKFTEILKKHNGIMIDFFRGNW